MEIEVLFEKKCYLYVQLHCKKCRDINFSDKQIVKLQINPAFDTTKKVRANILIHSGLLIHNWLFMDRHPYYVFDYNFIFFESDSKSCCTMYGGANFVGMKFRKKRGKTPPICQTSCGGNTYSRYRSCSPSLLFSLLCST